MTEEKRKMIDSLKMVAADVEADVRHFDGKPFDGRTVAEYFGYQAAAIKAIAEVVIELLENEPEHE